MSAVGTGEGHSVLFVNVADNAANLIDISVGEAVMNWKTQAFLGEFLGDREGAVGVLTQSRL